MENSTKREKLKEFYFQIKDCKKCGLYKSRTKFVFGSGCADAPVIFVGEAPGKNEDIQGKPFVGQAGKLLDKLLFSIGFERNQIFIANVLKCRPPENRDPRVDEIDICKKYLFRQIEIIDPKIICTMGKFSTQLLLNTSEGITNLRGKVFRIGGRIIFPINHPAAALYTQSRMTILMEDFQKIRSLLNSGAELEEDIENAEKKKGISRRSVASTLSINEAGSSTDVGNSNNKSKQLGLF